MLIYILFINIRSGKILFHRLIRNVTTDCFSRFSADILVVFVIPVYFFIMREISRELHAAYFSVRKIIGSCYNLKNTSNCLSNITKVQWLTAVDTLHSFTKPLSVKKRGINLNHLHPIRVLYSRTNSLV